MTCPPWGFVVDVEPCKLFNRPHPLRSFVESTIRDFAGNSSARQPCCPYSYHLPFGKMTVNCLRTAVWKAAIRGSSTAVSTGGELCSIISLRCVLWQPQSMASLKAAMVNSVANSQSTEVKRNCGLRRCEHRGFVALLRKIRNWRSRAIFSIGVQSCCDEYLSERGFLKETARAQYLTGVVMRILR